MTTPGRAFTIVPDGPFSLRESALFGFGQRSDTSYDGVMRLAFCVDDCREHAGVELRQPFRTWALVLIRAASDRPEPGTA